MFRKFINYIRRPDINEQNTGHEAFQQYNGYDYADYQGNGGHHYLRNMNATNPATIAVGPTHKLNDPSATGNPAVNLIVQPLQKDQLTMAVEALGGKQF